MDLNEASDNLPVSLGDDKVVKRCRAPTYSAEVVHEKLSPLFSLERDATDGRRQQMLQLEEEVLGVGITLSVVDNRAVHVIRPDIKRRGLALR